MAIKRYVGQPLPIVVTFPKSPLESYAKSYDDIEDVAMNFKILLATDLDTLYLQKTLLTSGVEVDASAHRFKMLLQSGDYTNLTAGQTYYLTLNVKFVGAPFFVELDIEDRAVMIVADTNRA